MNKYFIKLLDVIFVIAPIIAMNIIIAVMGLNSSPMNPYLIGVSIFVPIIILFYKQLANLSAKRHQFTHKINYVSEDSPSANDVKYKPTQFKTICTLAFGYTLYALIVVAFFVLVCNANS